MPPPHPLLIASLGNPPPYTQTLHSAGHHLLHSLHSLLLPHQAPFAPTRNGLLSPGPQYTLSHTPTLMNISGPAVAAAWKNFLQSLSGEDERRNARLVVLHDELEAAWGVVKVRASGKSAKGHNGVKSCVGALSGFGGAGGARFWRIGVGIGRPESRERGDVSAYVLRKMSVWEREKVAGAAGEVLGILEGLRLGGEAG